MTRFFLLSARQLALSLVFILLAFAPARAQGVAQGRIYSRAGEVMEVFLDGAPLGRPANAVVLPVLTGGYHWLEFRFPGRRLGMGVTGFRTQAWFAPDFESVYELDAFPRNGRMRLTRVSYAALGGYQQPTNYPPGQPQTGGYYQAPGGGQCANLLAPSDVDALLATIRQRDFENTRLSVAKQAVSAATILAEDVTRVLRTFEFENSRLDFAKFAYAHCCDPQNYFKVNAAFEFEASVTDLERFTQRGR